MEEVRSRPPGTLEPTRAGIQYRIKVGAIDAAALGPFKK